jgi:hypothetical protein
MVLSAMLLSTEQQLAFVHYPKTAGHSLTIWFQAMFPDARFVEPLTDHPISHLAVRPACERLGLAMGGGERHPLRVFGVLRDPFEMMVSLYEYWRAFDFGTKTDLPALIQTARTDSFYTFIGHAVGTYRLDPYDEFFDVEGPLWPNTRLIAFETLNAGLRRVLTEFGVEVPLLPLGRHNRGPTKQLDLACYRDLAGDQYDAVRHHYRWYYDEGQYLMVRG